MSAQQPSPPSPLPDSDATDAPAFRLDGLGYQLDRLPERHGKKSVVTVRLDGAPTDLGPPLVDRVDLFAFNGRRAFAGLVADAFGRQTGEIQGHLALILDAIERALTQDPTPRTEELTPERRVAAERLLEQPDLLDQAAAAMTVRGQGDPSQGRFEDRRSTSSSWSSISSNTTRVARPSRLGST